MNATLSPKSLSTSAFALLFAASLALGGCSASLTGPDAPADTPAKANVTAPAVDAPHNNGDGNGGGQTTIAGDHNEMPGME